MLPSDLAEIRLQEPNPGIWYNTINSECAYGGIKLSTGCFYLALNPKFRYYFDVNTIGFPGVYYTVINNGCPLGGDRLETKSGPACRYALGDPAVLSVFAEQVEIDYQLGGVMYNPGGYGCRGSNVRYGDWCKLRDVDQKTLYFKDGNFVWYDSVNNTCPTGGRFEDGKCLVVRYAQQAVLFEHFSKGGGQISVWNTQCRNLYEWDSFWDMRISSHSLVGRTTCLVYYQGLDCTGTSIVHFSSNFGYASDWNDKARSFQVGVNKNGQCIFNF
jgi:hypothetical protein